MRALVVYESMFGNNALIAQAISSGHRTAGVESTCEEVGHTSTPPADVDLLIVGCPNHGWSMPRPATRVEATRYTDHPLVSSGIGVREWLSDLRLADTVRVAAYDTRSSRASLLAKFDHANSSVEKALRRSGGRKLAPAQSFLVVDMTGPLVDGEIERAERWGQELARLALS